MNDLNLRFEQGEMHMPPRIAEWTGLPNPYRGDSDQVLADLVQADSEFMRANVEADVAMRREDHAQWSRLDAVSNKMYMRRTVLQLALDELEVEEGLKNFDEQLQSLLGPSETDR